MLRPRLPGSARRCEPGTLPPSSNLWIDLHVMGTTGIVHTLDRTRQRSTVALRGSALSGPENSPLPPSQHLDCGLYRMAATTAGGHRASGLCGGVHLERPGIGQCCHTCTNLRCADSTRQGLRSHPRRHRSRIERFMSRAMGRFGGDVVFGAALLPIIPLDVAGLIAGASGYPKKSSSCTWH
jgi:hypothetical protein